jgi:hypothetical protein
MVFNKVSPIFESISENGLVTIAVWGLWKMPLEELCRRIVVVSRCGSLLLDEWFWTFQGISVLHSWRWRRSDHPEISWTATQDLSLQQHCSENFSPYRINICVPVLCRFRPSVLTQHLRLEQRSMVTVRHLLHQQLCTDPTSARHFSVPLPQDHMLVHCSLPLHLVLEVW